MSQLLSTTLGPVRLLGENATPIWGMSNAERNRRMAESAAKSGSTLATGHELLFNLAYAFDPLLLRLALETPGTIFVWGAKPIVGQVPQGADPLTAAHVIDLSDGRKLYNRQLRKLEQPMVRELTPASWTRWTESWRAAPSPRPKGAM